MIVNKTGKFRGVKTIPPLFSGIFFLHTHPLGRRKTPYPRDL